MQASKVTVPVSVAVGGGTESEAKVQHQLINDWIPGAIPIDVGTAGVVTGGDRPASRRTRWGNGVAVRHDIAVFEVTRMAVAESDLAALTMP